MDCGREVSNSVKLSSSGQSVALVVACYCINKCMATIDIGFETYIYMYKNVNVEWMYLSK